MIPDEEKAKIGEKLKMYDPLWEEHPRVKKIKAEANQARVEAEANQARAEAEAAKAKAEAEAEIRATREAAKTQLQRAMVYVVRVRFPRLTELAQQSTQQIDSLDILGFLLDKIEGAESEAEARRLLLPPAA